MKFRQYLMETVSENDWQDLIIALQFLLDKFNNKFKYLNAGISFNKNEIYLNLGIDDKKQNLNDERTNMQKLALICLKDINPKFVGMEKPKWIDPKFGEYGITHERFVFKVDLEKLKEVSSELNSDKKKFKKYANMVKV